TCEAWMEQLRQFLESLARMNKEWRPAVAGVPAVLRRRTLRQCRRQYVEKLACRTPHLKPLPANLNQLPPAECYEVIAALCREGIAELVASLVSMLDSGVAQGLLGRITWTGPRTCSYTFGRWVIVVEDVKKELRNGSETGARRNPYRHAEHLHEVIGATENRDIPPGLYIPQRVGEGLHMVPGWLRPHLRIITGTQTRERIVERDTHSERWQHTTPRPRVVERTSRRWDPAIVLGEVVLSGWGLLDSRREAESPVAPQGRPLGGEPWWKRLLSLFASES